MNLYQHFRKEEHAFIDQVLEWKDVVDIQYRPKLTDFLDPREQEIVKQVIGHNGDVLVDFLGGNPTAERKRALLFPQYYQPTDDDFMLTYLEIHYPVKFVSIDHRKVLGTLMSLGLKRGKFGDILTNEELMQFIAANEIADYLMLNLQSIGKATVSLRKISKEDLIEEIEEWTEQVTTVSSLRLDVVLAAIYNLSRQKVQTIIQNGLVKVNWKITDQSSFECREDDVLSVRGFGRSRIHMIEGKTKRDKWRIKIGRQI
ncbi:RNA-binding protein [Fredinandcohnia quinoae]|uniref:RNA-binding protein n=1 Tax=Fredinandcohnia quinoae TaxID=2918902 RepID=A0AAW5DU03_9BACI|nr:RNA-binding protein [Fredinandcohnia sp. SECRCQ15]MCH1623858.1 RNA-binding protein [Fredinandcohnia sp. SECRCQ15]